MGLIRAALNAAGGTMASQWKEYFYVDALPDNVLVAKAQKKVKGRFGGSRHEDDNVISAGSVIAVNEGQCMMIVDQGKIVDFCAEPGEYIFDENGEPSIFYGAFNGEKIKQVLKTTFDRFSFGGQAGRDQRVYFFNIKEIPGNKYGTPSPVPFRVVDNNIGLDVDISIRCFGEYSYKLINPMLFYVNVCGNVDGEYTCDTIDSQLKSELLTALQPAFARISDMGVRYSALPGHTQELADALNDVLSEKWRDLRGIEIVAFGVNSVKASDEDEKMIKELQRNAVFRNPGMAAAQLVGAQAQAMQDAANNKAGAFTGFMGMNGGAGRRHERPGAVQYGCTAEDPAAGTGSGCGCMEVLLRRDGHGQILPRVRRKEARAQTGGRVEVPFLRRNGYGQVLPRMRRKEARGAGLDMLLRRGKYRQVLLRMRRKASRGRADIPLRQVRLAARGSRASA